MDQATVNTVEVLRQRRLVPAESSSRNGDASREVRLRGCAATARRIVSGRESATASTRGGPVASPSR